MVTAAKEISVTGAAFGYKKKGRDLTITSGVNVGFYAGDFVGVVGLNGTGKSTFLKTLCGLLPLLSGEIRIGEHAISSLMPEDLARKISIVLTEKIYGFNLTAYDVVAAGRLPYTGPFNKLSGTDVSIVESAILSCGINNHQDKHLTELSDGLFQKTVIAKALAQQTPVMLLDEPSAFLDYASKYDLFLLLKELSDTHDKCILASSHDLDLLLKYCNKLLVLSGGVAELIPVSEARQNPAFLKIGGGFI